MNPLSCLRFLLWCFIGALPVQAHVVQQFYSEFQTNPERWQLSIRYDAGYALPEMRADTMAMQPKREWLTSQSLEQQQKLHQAASDYIRNTLQIQSSGQPVSYEIHFPEWATDPPKIRKPFTDTGFAYFDLVLSGPLPPAGHSLDIVEMQGQHPNFLVALLQTSGDPINLVLTPGQSVCLIRSSGLPPTLIERMSNFFRFGFDHVLPKGWDHVLFILAMTGLGLHWRALLTQSLLFTLAHSLTLGLAVAQIIPPLNEFWQRGIEILIAASIIHLALENLRKSEPDRARLVTIFLFGLIHGLGFASVLGEQIRAAGGIFLPLLSANLGIEAAQILLIIAASLMLLLLRRIQLESPVRKFASVLIAMIASYWVMERLGWIGA